MGKRKKQNKKLRNSCLTYEFGREQTIDRIEINTLNGQVIPSFQGYTVPITSSFINRGYDRRTKRKILKQIEIPSNLPSLDLNILLGQYDTVFSIDTNTALIKSSMVSVAAVILCNVKHLSNLISFSFAPTHAFAMWNVIEKPENIAWVELIQRLPVSAKGLKIGVVVDSELGNISEYNKRKIPIFADFYLPPNVQFVYASTDSGKEFVANRMLSLADSEAKKLIRVVRSDPDFLDACSMEDKPYSHLRWWDWIKK